MAVNESPTVVRGTWAEVSAFLKKTNAENPLASTVGFALSNGLVGLGVWGAYPADSEGSEFNTLFLAQHFTDVGVRSLQPLPNPISACIWDHGTGDGIDLGGDVNKQTAILAFDAHTGIYSAQFQYGRVSANWELLLPPKRKTFVERLTIVGKPGEKIPISINNGGALDWYIQQQSSIGFENQWVLGSTGKAILEICHGFNPGAKRESFDEAARQNRDWASGAAAPRITIEGPIDDQQAVNSMLYHLRSGVNPSGPTGPFGLTNPKYGGRAFWDSDTWMFPALALLDPERAASIPRFRLSTRKAATELAYQWAQESRSQFEPSVTPYKFPWEAGPDGRENAIGDSQHQEHITADVAHCLLQASALGLVPDAEASSTIQGCAQYLWHRATRLADGEWGVLRTMSPDEFHTGDNDLYTNVAFEQILKAGFPDRWQAWSFKRPKDATTFLTYDNDGLRGYKQAAALLAIWPLQDPACEAEATKMLTRFAGKSTKSGPAMSTSVEALVTARFGGGDDAYRLWRDSWQRYTKRPMMMFSEAPNGRNAYFLTGAAGCLDALLYGLIGLRIDNRDPGQRPWKIPLRRGYWLSCSPNLPEAWKSVTVDNLTVLGKRYQVKASGRTVSVSLMR